MDMRIAKIVYGDKAHTSLESTYYTHDAQGNVMATYTRSRKNNPGNEGISNRFEDSYTLNDHTLYGSSRLGTETSDKLMAQRFYLASVNAYNLETGYDANGNLVSASAGDNTLEQFTYDYTARVVGDKSYELSNHLGNVLAVVTDRKVPLTVNGVLVYSADVISYSDYSPYGVELDGRHASSGYRYGFQGQESDDEVKGEGNSVNYKYRMHDPRIGRFFAVDPLAPKYPELTPYQFSSNNPIGMREIEGLEGEPVNPESIPVSSSSSSTFSINQYSYGTSYTTTTTTTTTTFNWDTRNYKITEQTEYVTNMHWSGGSMDGKITKSSFKSDPVVSEKSYEEATGNSWNPYQIILDGFRSSPEYKNVSKDDEQGKIRRWNIEQNLLTQARGNGAKRLNLDETVFAFLPWYQIARGIQDIQQGNHWGWLRIGLEITPLPMVTKPFVKASVPIIRMATSYTTKYLGKPIANYIYHSSKLGVNSHLFGIGRSGYTKGLWNQGAIRLGWGFNGLTREHSFGLRLGYNPRMGYTPSHLFHYDIHLHVPFFSTPSRF
jgi:RHS repeat-associated protein